LLNDAGRAERLAGILAQDRAERFDLGAAPLLRFTLIRLAPDRHRLVLTNHHILMDGWSTPVLVQELFTLYAQRDNAGALPRVTPYRDYLAWIAAQDRDAAIAVWRDALAGLDAATRVAAHDPGRAPIMPEQITLALSEPLTTALSLAARRQGLTLNTLVQAAWAILLGRMTGRDDVVFGVTVAGRPPEIAGIERMVGLFINTLPLRIKLPPAKSLATFLREVQESQSGLAAQQHLGLAEIQNLAGLGDLFDTLMVFESYPVDRDGLAAGAAGLRLTDISGRDATHYPLSLAATPGERLQLRLDYRPDLFDRDSLYGAQFQQRVGNMGIKEVKIAPRSPWQSPYVERLIGNIRRECLNDVVVLNERHLRRVLRSYVGYYHIWRVHRSLDRDAPNPRPVQPPELGGVTKRPEVGELHHHYERIAV
jgi:hypothetical protein